MLLLGSCGRISATRVGGGDAFAVAIRDARPLHKVEWYTMPLPGVVGVAGVKHSLLAITVGSSQDARHTYVMEKASASSEMRGLDAYKNDVFISHWRDVAPYVDGTPIYTLHAQDLENNTSKSDLSIRSLRDFAVELGPYNVATCNCHHMALSVFNACARQPARVKDLQMPNSMLIHMAEILRSTGLAFV